MPHGIGLAARTRTWSCRKDSAARIDAPGGIKAWVRIEEWPAGTVPKRLWKATLPARNSLLSGWIARQAHFAYRQNRFRQTFDRYPMRSGWAEGALNVASNQTACVPLRVPDRVHTSPSCSTM